MTKSVSFGISPTEPIVEGVGGIEGAGLGIDGGTSFIDPWPSKPII